MTPDFTARARELASQLVGMPIDGPNGWDMIATALIAAVEEERKRCAKIADAHRGNTAKLATMPTQSEAAYQIANEIRKGE